MSEIWLVEIVDQLGYPSEYHAFALEYKAKEFITDRFEIDDSRETNLGEVFFEDAEEAVAFLVKIPYTEDGC